RTVVRTVDRQQCSLSSGPIGSPFSLHAKALSWFHLFLFPFTPLTVVLFFLSSITNQLLVLFLIVFLSPNPSALIQPASSNSDFACSVYRLSFIPFSATCSNRTPYRSTPKKSLTTLGVLSHINIFKNDAVHTSSPSAAQPAASQKGSSDLSSHRNPRTQPAYCTHLLRRHHFCFCTFLPCL
ncbi:hypothetical protein SERLA73DRAFT_185628, partial [Serpula lacrymans var. lacrymans S7.3]